MEPGDHAVVAAVHVENVWYAAFFQQVVRFLLVGVFQHDVHAGAEAEVDFAFLDQVADVELEDLVAAVALVTHLVVHRVDRHHVHRHRRMVQRL